mmetsp:Transcript_11840/g.22161  ORF Transcript_11840/g.22161 Transcript_11840/m.22161 type:complete len:919 (+) Transcript_11840:122-2878(+)
MSLSFEPVKSPPFLSPYLTKDTKLRSIPPSSGKARKAAISDGGSATRPSSLSSPSPLTRQYQFQCNSVSLSCLSPDSRSVHSLLPNGTIVTRFLPIHETPDSIQELSSRTSLSHSKTPSNLSRVHSITTTLPSYVVESLQVDPPLEIICIDNHTPTKKNRGATNKNLYALPLLCVYSQRSAFVIQIQYEEANASNEESLDQYSTELETLGPRDGRIKGTVLEPVHEPFESFLTTTSGVIQRIRSAPHSYMYNGNTYQTLCSKGAMIMLGSSGDAEGEPSMVIFHGYDPTYDNNILQSWKSLSTNPFNVTIPAKVHSEQTGMSPIVDFCFLPSMPLTEHSIWNAMTVVLCTANGSLYGLSPIVFHNTVFPYHMIKHGRELLEKNVILYEHSADKGAECRRAKAAMQFLKDVFGNAFNDVYITKDSYAKTNVMHPSTRMNAVLWPVAVQTLQQGSVFDGVKCMDIIPPSCVASAVMNNGTSSIVLATNSAVEFRIIPSGNNILPRFAFESGGDRHYLDDMCADSVVTIERVYFGQDESDSDQGYADDDTGSNRSIVLIPDPVDRSMLHRVSKEGVMTVTTNVLSVLEKRLRSALHISGDSDDLTSKECETVAWPSIAMTKNPEKTLIGTVVSNDSQFGHVLVAALGDGIIEAVNMTAAMYLIEAKKQLEEVSKTTYSSAMKDSSLALREVESIKPLYQEIKPLFDQISSGLSNMTKIVGGSTQPKEITAGALATFLAIKQASEENISLPIKEMKSLIESRKNYLQSMRDSQIEQISQLREMMKVLNNRVKANAEKKDVLESNAGLLSQRSAAVLSTVRDLSPSITEAERLYFADIKRYKTKCDKYESTLSELMRQFNALRDDVKQGIENIELSADQVTSCFTLLDGQSDILKRIQISVGQIEENMETMVALSGLSDVRKS